MKFIIPSIIIFHFISGKSISIFKLPMKSIFQIKTDIVKLQPKVKQKN